MVAASRSAALDLGHAPTPEEGATFDRYARHVDRGVAGFEGGGRVVPLVFHEAFVPAERLSVAERRELAIKQAAIRIACGLETRSLRAIAKEIGCSHTAIDNRLDRLCKGLGLHKFLVSEQTRSRLRAARGVQLCKKR